MERNDVKLNRLYKTATSELFIPIAFNNESLLTGIRLNSYNPSNDYSQWISNLKYEFKVKDHIDLCCILITDRTVTITPSYIPITTLPYFDKDVRRIYLSATLSAPDAFIRTYGKKPDVMIAPTTSAGELKRLA